MLSWENDRNYITSQINSRFHNLKIILKTSDDPILLPLWLKHYLSMLHPSQIIIADNMSVDPDVLQIYESLDKEITIFSYRDSVNRGFHNNIHDRSLFCELYNSLSRSSDYVLAVDTDEFLYVFETDAWSAERSGLERRLAQAEGKALSSTWLHTTRGSTDTCYIGRDVERLSWDLRWGKPVIPSTYTGAGVRIHNVQFPFELFDAENSGALFLLHLREYSREQRLRVNRKKLIVRGAVTHDETFESIASKDISQTSDPTVKRLVSEISDLLHQQWQPEESRTLSGGCMRLLPDRRIAYADELTRKAMFDYRADFASHLRAAFEAPETKMANQQTPQGIRPALPESLPRPRYEQSSATICRLSLEAHLSRSEREVFASHIRDTRFLLEFGCGGSTVLAATLGVPKIVSVDSDRAWLDKVAGAPELADVDFTPVHIDIGPTRDWGVPGDSSRAVAWPNYYKSVWGRLLSEPDVIFVDGRFRVACALHAILTCRKRSKYIIHDFWDRPHYHCVLDFLDCIERNETIGVFTTKEGLDWQKLARLLLDHALDYR